MQTEISAQVTPRPLRILGVNAVGEDADNALVCAGRTLPWLQDTAVANVWGLWDVTYRDVVILDAENRVHAVYNLTQHDLANAANYQALKSLLLAAAAR